MHYPETREQLQMIIKNARTAKTNLVPVSSGAPHLHKASENDSAELVSFERMNKILKIDSLNRYIRVESGVTFGEIIPLVTESGMRLNMPFLPRPNKSVVTSALEREAVLVPKYQYDYTDPLLTVVAVVHVILGTNHGAPEHVALVFTNLFVEGAEEVVNCCMCCGECLSEWCVEVNLAA
jgi:hypothetical protein